MSPVPQQPIDTSKTAFSQIQSALEPHYDRLIERFSQFPPSTAVGFGGDWYNAQEVVDALIATRAGMVLVDAIGSRLQPALVTLVDETPGILTLPSLDSVQVGYLRKRYQDRVAQQQRKV